MAIIHYVICARNLWNKGSTLNYINIQPPVYFNVLLQGNLLLLTALTTLGDNKLILNTLDLN